MSKRVQVVLADEDYRALASVALTRGMSMSQVVRESLRHTVAEDAEPDVSGRIVAIRRLSRYAGPTADIEELIADIERGRGLA